MNSQYLTRFAELFEQRGRRVEVFDNKFWMNNGKMIVHIGPIQLDYSLTEDQAHKLLKKFPGGLLVRFTEGFDIPNNSEEWYAVICDNFKDLGDIRHESRRAIKRGLENCDVRQVDADFISKCGYEVYASAFSRYQDVIKPLDKNEFTRTINTTIPFDDIYHYWAVFHKKKFIAYSAVAIYGDDEAEISAVKSIPEYHKLYPSNVLFYTMNKHYLANNSMKYVNAGYRNIFHKTQIQDFLIKRLSFKKSYMNVGIIYNSKYKYFVKVTYPFQRMLSRYSHKLKAIFLLEDIRRQCTPGVTGGYCKIIQKYTHYKKMLPSLLWPLGGK